MDKKINKLAAELSKCGMNSEEYDIKFNELFCHCKKYFATFYNKYAITKHIKYNGFDIADYESAYSIAIYEAINDYDIKKGDFLGRVNTFALYRFRSITNYNFAKKRYNVKNISIPEIAENHLISNNFLDTDNTIMETINNFIQTDKHGEIISILLHNATRTSRRLAFIDYFGKFDVRERKIVQRTRERLLEKLKEEEICL